MTKRVGTQVAPALSLRSSIDLSLALGGRILLKNYFGGFPLVSRIRSSHDFAAPSIANFGFDKDTSKLLFLVALVQKSARRTSGVTDADF